MNTELIDKQRFDELIVWYVNGTLNDDDRHWVEEYMRTHPASRHEFAWHYQLSSANGIQDLPIPDDVGLKNLLRQVNALPVKPQHSAMQNIFRFLAGLAARPAYAFTALVLLAQAVGLGVLVKEVHDRDRLISDLNQVRAIPNSTVASDMPTVDVTFKSSATEQEIRLLLVSIQANIIAGPRQLGDYTIALQAGVVEEARTTLQHSPIVEFVSSQRPIDGVKR